MPVTLNPISIDGSLTRKGSGAEPLTASLRKLCPGSQALRPVHLSSDRRPTAPHWQRLRRLTNGSPPFYVLDLSLAPELVENVLHPTGCS